MYKFRTKKKHEELSDAKVKENEINEVGYFHNPIADVVHSMCDSWNNGRVYM